MSRVRKIYRNPGLRLRNYYIVDACFLANKFIPPSCAPDQGERERVESCLAWWNEIDNQLRHDKARIFVPDICIAEAFKVLARSIIPNTGLKEPLIIIMPGND